MTSRQSRAQAGRDFRTNVREVGGRAATGMDRESARRTNGTSNAPKVIKDRTSNNAAKRRG
jgi:hypothetical protein